MNRTTRSHWLWFWLALSLGGCATVDPSASYQQAAALVTEATGEGQVYRPESQEVSRTRVTELLADGLTVQEAAQIALLNNRFLQASFFRIGVAQADLVQSSLFANPSLSGVVGFPSGGGLVALEGAVVQNIVDLWQIPIRKRVAERELNRVILEVARSASGLVLDVKRTYFEAVTAEQSVGLANENLGIARLLLELALALQEAGGGNEVDVNVARSEVLKNEVLLRWTGLRAYEARQTLLTMLGLSLDGTGIPLVGGLPETPTWSVTSDLLLDRAKHYRLDLRAAKEWVEVAKDRVQLQQRLFLRVVEPGLEFEREQRKAGEDTELTVGPTLNIELPLFDQNQAQIARAEFQYEEAVKVLEGLLVSITQEVRGAHKRAETLWSLTRFYENRVLPQEQQSLELARDAYRLGETSFLSVLEAQKSFLAAREQHLETLRDSANTLVDLEQVTGQPLSGIAPATEGLESTLEKDNP